MRTEEEMYSLILKIATENEKIKAVYMNGSRANEKVYKDCYRDYDIVYVVEDTKPFLENREWLLEFGELLISQEPDFMDCKKEVPKSEDFPKTYIWLMLFKDKNRIDLRIETVENMLSHFGEDSLTKILLDKCNILPKIAPANDSSYHIKKPTKKQYDNCCNEFWWCLNNVCKGINRHQLPYSMWMYNTPVRDSLNKMLNFYVGINNNFNVTCGMEGKYYSKYLPVKMYEKLEKTYSRGSYSALWEAIENATSLFREVAREVSSKLEFSYDETQDKNMVEYIKEMKSVFTN